MAKRVCHRRRMGNQCSGFPSGFLPRFVSKRFLVFQSIPVEVWWDSTHAPVSCISPLSRKKHPRHHRAGSELEVPSTELPGGPGSDIQVVSRQVDTAHSRVDTAHRQWFRRTAEWIWPTSRRVRWSWTGFIGRRHSSTGRKHVELDDLIMPRLSRMTYSYPHPHFAMQRGQGVAPVRHYRGRAQQAQDSQGLLLRVLQLLDVLNSLAFMLPVHRGSDRGSGPPVTLPSPTHPG